MSSFSQALKMTETAGYCDAVLVLYTKVAHKRKLRVLKKVAVDSGDSIEALEALRDDLQTPVIDP